MSGPIRGLGPTRLPEEAYAAALSGLPGANWRRLGLLLAAHHAEDVWGLLQAPNPLQADVVAEALARAKKPAEAAARWRAFARSWDVAAGWRRTRSVGAAVFILGRPNYPAALAGDPEPPAVLFLRGRLPASTQPAVALVGTRHCSLDGREVARALGYGLAEAGVVVVSGLALGIDGAAHQGALAVEGAPPLGVVASGVDVVYPPSHGALWEEVAAVGGLLSETRPGAPARKRGFPLRNRLIAGLSRVVVVVESREAGGSRHTVDAAIVRGVNVMAVPGSPRNPAAAGTNQLLAEGCAPVRDVEDILTALALEGCVSASPRPAANPRPAPSPSGRRSGDRSGRAPAPPTGRASRLSGTDADVFVAVTARPASSDTIVLRTGLSPMSVTATLERLAAEGLVVHEAGWWSRAD